MDDPPDWLPEIFEFDGDWNAFVDAVYAKFCDDVVRSIVLFQGSRVSVRRVPETDGKGFGFWHCVSEGHDETSRTPDLSRCERICWIRAVIENHPDPRIDHWTNQRGRDTHHLLWLDEEYLVVLAQRNGYFLLKTAYLTQRGHTVRRLRKERDSSKNG